MVNQDIGHSWRRSEGIAFKGGSQNFTWCYGCNICTIWKADSITWQYRTERSCLSHKRGLKALNLCEWQPGSGIFQSEPSTSHTQLETGRAQHLLGETEFPWSFGALTLKKCFCAGPRHSHSSQVRDTAMSWAVTNPCNNMRPPLSTCHPRTVSPAVPAWGWIQRRVHRPWETK